MTHPVADADADAVAEVAIDKPSSLPSRRDVLKLGAIVTSAVALGASTEAAHADDDAPLSYGASQASEAAVALPSLAVIALNRLAWGPRSDDAFTSIDYFNNPTHGADDTARLQYWVNEQLNPTFLSQPDDSDSRIAAAAANLPSLTLPIAQLWEAYYKTMGAVRNKPAGDTRVATLIRAVYSPKQLREVMVDFWHNHFSIYAWDGAYAGATWASYDRDAIRPYALGNFRAMLEAVTKSTAMLFYLDNFINQVAGFNENWSRELMELHTLGTENYFGTVNPDTVPKYPPVNDVSIAVGYTDEDVYEGAACFTGWRVNNGQSGAPGNTGEFYYHEVWHDKRGKNFMGAKFPGFDAQLRDGLSVLDILAGHPGTARYIVRKLWRRLIGDNAPEPAAPGATAPPNPTFDAAVAKWLELWNPATPGSDGQIREVVRILATSPEFLSTWGQKVKRPHEALYSALRALPTNIVVDGGGLSSLWGAFNVIGQEMFGRRTPDGYPDIRDAWTNSTSMLYRWRMFNSLLENSFYNSSSGTGVQMDNATLISLMGGLNTPTTIADFWINRILNRAMDDPNHRMEVIKLMQGWDTGNNSTSVKPVYAADAVMTATDISNRLRRMIAVILMSPEFQWR
jgi:uncharacterized protein (DUF1800 family)